MIAETEARRTAKRMAQTGGFRARGISAADSQPRYTRSELAGGQKEIATP
jgi:hypothetical protein